MIDTRELRIGNYVQHFNEIIQVSQVGKNSILYEKDGVSTVIATIWDVSDFNGSEVTPIPITPEWLERLGLRFFKTGGIVGGYLLNGWDYWSINTPKGATSPICQKGDTFRFNGYGYIEIKYVHQFQNIIFATTGQELTVKELTATI